MNQGMDHIFGTGGEEGYRENHQSLGNGIQRHNHSGNGCLDVEQRPPEHARKKAQARLGCQVNAPHPPGSEVRQVPQAEARQRAPHFTRVQSRKIDCNEGQIGFDARDREMMGNRRLCQDHGDDP